MSGGSGDDTVIYDDPAQINGQNDQIDGGVGTDTLTLAWASYFYDLTEANIINIEVLQLAYGNSVLLLPAQLVGLTAINGDYYSAVKLNGSANFSDIAVSNLISLEAGSTDVDAVVGSVDDNTFTFKDSAKLNNQADSIDGGAGIDTLALLGDVQLYDISQVILANIETLQLGWGINVVLSANQLTDIATINGDYYSVVQIEGSVDLSGVAISNLVSFEAGSAQVDTLVGSSGDDTFVFKDEAKLNSQADSIDGGIGSDTLALMGDAQSYDITQASLSNIEILQLGWGIVVGLTADQLANLQTINSDYNAVVKINGSVDLSGIAVSNLVTVEAGSTGSDNLIGSAGDNTFRFNDSANINNNWSDSIDGGAGTDTLALMGEAQSYDITQVNLSNLEAMNLGWGESVFLTAAQVAAFQTINSDYNTILKVDGSLDASNTAISSLVSIEAGSTSADILVGSAGDNTFTFKVGDNINNQSDSINGGDGTDTLALSGQEQSYDITQAILADIETLTLGWGSDVTLAADQLANIRTINGDYFTTLKINGSVNFSGTTISNLLNIAAGSSAADDILVGSADDNTFLFKTGTNINLQADSIDGGAGTDTLALTGQEMAYNISQANLSRIETLNLGWGSAVTVKASQLADIHNINGDYYSILKIDGSVNLSNIGVSNLVSVMAGSVGIDSLVGSADDNTFVFMNGANLNQQADSIDGGDGIDTLALKGQEKVYDLTQATLTSIESLYLGWSNSATLTAAQLAGMQTITGDYYSTLKIGGSVDLSGIAVLNLVSVAAGSSGIDTLIGSADDNTFVFADSGNISGQADSIDGGAGNDTLYLSGLMGSYDLTAVDLSNIETVKLAYGTTVILTPEQIGPLTTIYGDYYSLVQVNGSFDISQISLTGFVGIAVGSTEIDTVVGSTGDDTFVVNNADNINGQADNLDGGEGSNTLYLAGDNSTFDITQAVLSNFDELEMAYGNEVSLLADQVIQFGAFDGASYGTIHVAGSNDHSTVKLAGIFGIEGLTAPVSSVHNHLGAKGQADVPMSKVANPATSLLFNAGNDVLSGSAGNDLYVVNGTSNKIVEVKNGGVDTVQSTVSSILPGNLENMTLVGAANINATGNALGNQLLGNDGINTLQGFVGNDVLFGGGGKDRLVGGLGNDRYWLNGDGDVVVEKTGQGIDAVFSSASYTLGSNVENLTLMGRDNAQGIGNPLNNMVTGNSGDNTLDGGIGADTLKGGLGNDAYFVDNVGDMVTETSKVTSEIDIIKSSLSWVLTANIENLALLGAGNIDATGNGLANILNGNVGNNILAGNAGNDNLAGNAGNDVLIGGLGNDKLNGGLGSDIFRFDAGLTNNRDTIIGYNVADDTIQLASSVFKSLVTAGELTADMFVSGAGITAAADANDFLIYNSSTGALYYDADGNGTGAAIQFITLSAGLALTHADFFII